MEVRRARAPDAHAIAMVHIESWRAAYAGLVPDDFLAQMSVEQRAQAWCEILDATDWPTRGTLVLMGDDGGDAADGSDGEEVKEVVGFANIGPSRDDDAAPGTGELCAIYLHPDSWGTGGGRRLLAEALARLGEAGFDQATLWVLSENERARRFYEADGWSPDGAERTESRAGFELNEVRYRRTL